MCMSAVLSSSWIFILLLPNLYIGYILHFHCRCFIFWMVISGCFILVILSYVTWVSLCTFTLQINFSVCNLQPNNFCLGRKGLLNYLLILLRTEVPFKQSTNPRNCQIPVLCYPCSFRDIRMLHHPAAGSVRMAGQWCCHVSWTLQFFIYHSYLDTTATVQLGQGILNMMSTFNSKWTRSIILLGCAVIV